MKIQKMLLLIVVLIANYSTTIAQTTPAEIADKFFATYDSKGSTIALEELYATNRWMDKAGDAILNLKNQMEGLTEDFIGKCYGHELITEKKISDSFVLLSYLVKFDRQPIRYTFQFYKPDQEWRIHSFKYDGKLENELEESAKLHYLNYGQ